MMEPPVRFNIGPLSPSPTPSHPAIDALDDCGQRPPGLTRSSSLQVILASISAERQGSEGGGGGGDRVRFWTNLLVMHFLEEEDPTACGGGGGGFTNGVGGGNADLKDDLVFYVRRRQQASADEARDSGGRSVEVHRRWQHNYHQILSDQLIDVEESVYLNLIMQHFSYTVTCAVCTRTGARQLQILKRFSTRVFASPSRHCMDGKASREEITYPDIVFSIHNYDDLFADCVVRDSEILCVELVARDRLGEFQGVLFLGSVRYETILEVYAAKNGGGGFSAYQPSTWFRAPRRIEFLRMRGPRGKGRAEVAVSRAEAAPPTPESELDGPAGGGVQAALGNAPLGAGQLGPPDPAATRRTRRLSGTNNHQRQGAPAPQPGSAWVGSGRPPARAGSAASLRSWGLSGLMKKSRSDSENVETLASAAAASASAPAAPSEVEARGIEEELDEGAGAGGIWGQAWHWFKERRRASSIGLAAGLTCVSLPWHRIVADLLDAGQHQQPVLAAFEDLPGGAGEPGAET